jgi:hypothetical protein
MDIRQINSGRTRTFPTLSSFASLRIRSANAIAPISCSGLPNGRQWRICNACELDIVEAH